MSSIPSGAPSRARGKRGQESWYLAGSASRLLLAEQEPGDEIVGGWRRQDLIKMDANFCAAMERAIKRGLERRPEQGRARAA